MSSVDLPEPLCPRRPIRSPRRTVRETRSSARTWIVPLTRLESFPPTAIFRTASQMEMRLRGVKIGKVDRDVAQRKTDARRSSARGSGPLPAGPGFVIRPLMSNLCVH